MTDHSAEYVAVEVAGKLADISPRTLRHWIAVGKLSAIAGKRGKLVSVEEVHALAVLTGKAPGNATSPADNPATSAAGIAGNVAEDAQPQAGAGQGSDVRTVVVSPAASAQLAAIRDEWLQPLVDRIAALERERGRLEAQRDTAAQTIEELRRRAEAAERECEEIRQRHEALRASAIFRESPAPPAATSEAEGHEHDLGDLRPLGRLQRLWRALRGR